MLYINENISCRPLNKHPKFPHVELIVFELCQSKRKWLFLGIKKPLCQNNIEFLNRINSVLDHYLTIYENIILIGDLNLCAENTHLEVTIENYNLNNLTSKATCYQSNNSTCIDLILTNKKNLFELSDTFEMGLSDHHKFISTILKSRGFKGKPKEKIYRSYKQFNSEGFKKDLEFRLNHLTSSSYNDFETTFLKESNRHAPLKKTILRHSNNRFVAKELRKAIMLRAKPKNIFNKDKTHFNR